jgi:hypothetical protein
MENIIIPIKKHPDYEATIEEVVNKNIDQNLMAEALKYSKREDRAEALYVLLKLKGSLSQL